MTCHARIPYVGVHHPLYTPFHATRLDASTYILFSSIFPLSSPVFHPLSPSPSCANTRTRGIRMHTDVFCLTCSILLMDFGRVSREEERKRNGKTVVNVDGSALECFLSKKGRRASSRFLPCMVRENRSQCVCASGKISTGTSIEINSSIYRSFDNTSQWRNKETNGKSHE